MSKIFAFTLSAKYAKVSSIIEKLYTAAKSGNFYLGRNDGMAIINLTLQGADGERLLTLCEKDARFVMAKTLTQTAQVAQTEIKKHIREAFVLRKPNFEKSIKIRPATKQDMRAEIYTMAGFAALQQTGGKQTARSGRLAVPRYGDLRDVKAGRKSNAEGSFLVKLKSGGHAIASKAGTETRILYYLKQVAYMPKRLNMLEIGEDVAVKQIPALFRANIQQT